MPKEGPATRKTGKLTTGRNITWTLRNYYYYYSIIGHYKTDYSGIEDSRQITDCSC